MEEQLRQLIEQAKATNNIVLVEQLTQALNTYMTQQKEQEDIKLKSQENINQEQNSIIEEKKEVLIENKQDEEKKEEKRLKEDDIKKIVTGEVSKLITTKTNNHILESKYMDIRPSAKNFELRVDLDSVLVTLALDDVTKEKKAIEKLYKILDKYEKPEDAYDIQVFLNDIAKVGHVGLEAKESIADNYDNNHKKEAINRYFDDEYEEKKKNADLLEMELEELHGKSNKNPNDYEEMIDRYNFLIQRLEELYDETLHKVSDEKSQKLEETIKYLKNKVTNLKKYLNSLKEVIDENNRLFNY